MKFESPCFTTATGKTVCLVDPDGSSVSIEDIAWSLARQCRWAGHLKPGIEHYSVAQHSVMVSFICQPKHALVGLLHDATEAYLQDLIRPLKRFLGERYESLEMHWAFRIGREFGLDRALVWLPEDVKHADRVALETERRDLVSSSSSLEHHIEPCARPITPLSITRAYEAFRRRFDVLRRSS